jgi:hypothetical protein
MRRAVAAALVALSLAAGGVARAQFVVSGDRLDQPAQQNVDETKLRGRLSFTTEVYKESSTPAAGTNSEASPDTLFFGDVRARLEAEHIKGGKWNFTGDLRLRYTPNDFYTNTTSRLPGDTITSSRGWYGGKEYELKEAYFMHRGVKADASVGRMILRDVDAMTVDGVALGVRKSPKIEYGLAAGAFPNPYSRSLTTDYSLPIDDTRTITEYPLAGAGWAGYRTAQAYGSFGVGAIFPRNKGSFKEDTRTFVTARGYTRFSPVLSLFHYLVFDFTGSAGKNLTNLQAGITWRPRPRLTMEIAYSHMSTYAIETFLRNLLEAPAATGVPGMVLNNLDVARSAADEGRVGGDYSMLEKRIDVFAQVRYRRRGIIASPKLDTTIAALPADTQIDVSLGARKKRWIKGWDVGGTVAVIRGGRTSSNWAFLRGNRTFMDDRLDVDLDLGYIQYTDECGGTVAAPTDPTCVADSSGSTIRAGGSIVFRKSERWLVLADYHFGYNTGTQNNVARPAVTEHNGMLRAQYSF